MLEYERDSFTTADSWTASTQTVTIPVGRFIDVSAISSDNAIFATPGVNIGLFCSTPMVAVSRKVSRKKTMKMLLTGDPIDAK